MNCEQKEKPFRMYYKDDWRCDCKTHTENDYIKILNNIFNTNDALFNEYVNWQNKPDDYYSVTTRLECIDAVMLRTAEFHGLMISRIYNDGNKIALHFTPTGFFSDNTSEEMGLKK